MPPPHLRVLRLIAIAAVSWSALVWLTGGVSFSIARQRFTSTDPLRPLAVAAVAAIAYAVAGGAARARDDARAVVRAVGSPARWAFALAIATTLMALAHNSWTASGADGYAYVSQADLWIAQTLSVPVPIAAEVPWPGAVATFTPFGYRPAIGRAAIVPVTAPGYPLLMAAFKLAAGHCAMFLVAPLAGGLLVWLIFAIGRAMGMPDVGLGAAWLAATSPIVLSMAKAPMSDVPAAAFWTLAMFVARGPSVASVAQGFSPARLRPLAAGAIASIAILIRPNLAPLAIAIAAWILWCDRSQPRGRFSRAAMFLAGAAPACFAIAAINHALYGSALRSGYGGVESLFSIRHVATNASRYGRWLVDTQSPLAPIAVVALFIPSETIWPDARAQRVRVLLAASLGIVCAAYLVYTPFEAWWYLRFLLPCWPAICLASAAFVFALARGRGRWARGAAIVVLLAVGAATTLTARTLGVFPVGERDRRYASIAEHVARVTEPSAVIITAQHAGSIRYYAGRVALRFDLLDPAWLDRAVDWLVEHGHHPYFLLEDWEVPRFEQRFAAANRRGRVDLTPVLAYKAFHTPDVLFLFDPLRPYGQTETPPGLADPRPRCMPPARP